MLKLVKLFYQIIFASVLPLVGFLVGWWGTISLVPEKAIWMCAMGGLLIGIAADMFFFRKWLQDVFRLPVAVYLLVYLFYSVCFFGFFMGVPLGNWLLGPFLAIYVVLRKDTDSRMEKLAIIGATSLMSIICLASGIIAWTDQYTISGLKGMLHIPFEITTLHLLLLIVVGGAFLIGSEYWMMKKTIFITKRKLFRVS